jgi:hypothetical protein
MATAIERLYDAFSKHRVTHLVGCECCTSQGELDALVTTPLRELPALELERYEWLLGNEDNLRHFMPRMIEASVLDDLELERRLQNAKWLQWPAEERDAVESYLRETVLAALEADEPVSLKQFSRLFDAFDSVRVRLETMLQRSVVRPRWYPREPHRPR